MHAPDPTRHPISPAPRCSTLACDPNPADGLNADVPARAATLALRPGLSHEAAVAVLEVVPSGSRPTLDASFFHALHDCYARHGLGELAVPVADDEHPLVRVVVMRDDNGVFLGGGRVHLRHARLGFPAETMLRHFADARARVRAMPAEQTVEIASLWTAGTGGNSGVARLVAQGCLAAAMQLGKRIAFTISNARFAPVLAAIGMVALPDVPELPFPAVGYRSRLFATDLDGCKLAMRCDREIITAISTSLRAGTDRMPLNELTSIEQGRPSWTIRRTTQRLRVA